MSNTGEHSKLCRGDGSRHCIDRFSTARNSKWGIPEDESIEIMKKYLGQCDLPVEIYIYDPNSPDDIFAELKASFLSLSEKELAEMTGLGKTYLKRVKQAMQDDRICSLSESGGNHCRQNNKQS